MPAKTVLVLANSVRSYPGSCVAGIELVEGAGRRWVRPVSEGSGEVSIAQRTLTNGQEVRVLDVVEMPLRGRVQGQVQPENWLVTGDRTWQSARRARFHELEELLERPASLWNEPGARTDSVDEGYLRRNPVQQSLFLVQPERLRVEFFTNDYNQRKRRAIFDYRGETYDLGTTDPEAPGRYGARYPAWSERRVVEISPRAYICVSLANVAFRGRHYKIVATIIDPTT